MKTIHKMTLSATLFTIGLVMTFGMVCNAQETLCALDGDHVNYEGNLRKGIPVVTFNKLEELPVEYARLLPLEVYFHWAKAHNAKQEASVVRTFDTDASVLESISASTGRIPATRGVTTSSLGGQFSSTTVNKAVIRNVTQPRYNKPITIYNPYFKGE